MKRSQRNPRFYLAFMLFYQILFFLKLLIVTAKKAWDKLKEEFEGSTTVKAIELITLKREFEILKMKDSDFVKDYTTKLMSIVNQIILAGE